MFRIPQGILSVTACSKFKFGNAGHILNNLATVLFAFGIISCNQHDHFYPARRLNSRVGDDTIVFPSKVPVAAVQSLQLLQLPQESRCGLHKTGHKINSVKSRLLA